MVISYIPKHHLSKEKWHVFTICVVFHNICHQHPAKLEQNTSNIHHIVTCRVSVSKWNQIVIIWLDSLETVLLVCSAAADPQDFNRPIKEQKRRRVKDVNEHRCTWQGFQCNYLWKFAQGEAYSSSSRKYIKGFLWTPNPASPPQLSIISHLPELSTERR